MNYVSLMQIAKSKHDLSSDKLHCWFHEATHFVDIVVDVASWKILEEEVDFELVLKDEVHGVYKWMFSLK